MSNVYEVTVEATVYKVIKVKAENEDKAIDQAHEYFSVLNGGRVKNQDTLRVAVYESRASKT